MHVYVSVCVCGWVSVRNLVGGTVAELLEMANLRGGEREREKLNVLVCVCGVHEREESEIERRDGREKRK